MSWTYPKLTHPQAKELARFIHQLRPDWDRPGIEHYLGKARDMAPGPDLAVAAIKAATSAHNRTPAVIPMQGDHWRTSSVETAPRRVVAPGEYCTTCGQAPDRCRQLAALPDDGHAYTPVSSRVDQTTGEITTPDAASYANRAREVLTTTKEAR